MNIINICFVCEDYPPSRIVGGVQIFTQTLARNLVQRGHGVSVVGYSHDVDAETEEDDQGVHVLRLPPVKPGLFPPGALMVRLRLEKAIRKLVRERDIDLVEVPDLNGVIVIGRLGAPLVVRMHGARITYLPAKGQKVRWIVALAEKRMLRLANCLVAVSQYMRDGTLEAAGLSGHKCEVIYNGIDTEIFKPDPDCLRDENRILFVGRLNKIKGAPKLFQALPIVFSRFRHTYLRFIGEDLTDDCGVKASVKLLSHLPMEYRSRVEFIGELPNHQLPIEYQSANIAVFPSQVESWGIVVCEAMACGIPVVFMNHGPGPEMLEHGKEGLLCDTSSPEAIAEAIIALLSNPVEARAMGARATECIASKLSLKSILDQNERFYLQCMETTNA